MPCVGFDAPCTVVLMLRGARGSCVAVQCISKCAEKFIKHAQRVGVRFGELSSEMEQQLKTQMESMKK
jgi:hypothetical protein